MFSKGKWRVFKQSRSGILGMVCPWKKGGRWQTAFWGNHVAAADQSARDAAQCGHGDNAASVCGPLGSDLAGGKAVSQLRLQDGPWWWQRGQRGPSHPVCLSAGVAISICIFYCICLFAWLISSGSHSQAGGVPSLSLPERKKENKNGAL